MKERWTKEQAWAWYDKQPWPMGINYVPAITLRSMELWQEDLFDEVMISVREEIKLMKSIGINTVRMSGQFNPWFLYGEAAFDRYDKFLAALDEGGISIMPVLYNDCTGADRPADPTPKKRTGWQPYDIGYHGGEKGNKTFEEQGPHAGWIIWDEQDWHATLEKFIREFIGRYANDPRIIAWDIWNEPGNGGRSDMSLPYLRRAFEVAREMNPIQPLTAGPWCFPQGYGVDPAIDLVGIQKEAVELSDIVSFHSYDCIDMIKAIVEMLEKEGRPMMNTEWMSRVTGNFIYDNLPLYHEKKIGSYSWGLVAGKSQHYQPWQFLRRQHGHLQYGHLTDYIPWTITGKACKYLDFSRWQHDLFFADHTPYDPKEIELMKTLSGTKDS